MGEKSHGLQSQLKHLLLGVSLLSVFVPAAAAGQVVEQPEYTLRLPSRVLQPQPGLAPELRSRLEAALVRGERRHVYLQLKRNLRRKERDRLEQEGVKLLGHVGGRTWLASVSDRRVLDFQLESEIQRAAALGEIRWIGEIQPADKIQPKIVEEGIGEYNRTTEGKVEVVVVFFRDVPAETVAAVVARHGEAVSEPGLLNDVVVRMEESEITALAESDEVQWIEEVGPPDQDLNDGAAAAANVAALWAVPYNLTGTNVQVGLWESGNPDSTHGDLTGRVTVVENEGVSDHASHTAGTLAGDGSLSAGEGGAANQWRGMADEAQIFSYSTKVDNLEPEDHDGAINDADKQIDVSSNSWGNAITDYTSRSEKYDAIVRGVYGRRIPIVFCAGNSNNTTNTVWQPGGVAKNTIVVGNVNSDNGSISIKSSWGPTNEGQTKPDVVAPGDEDGGDAGTTSAVADLFIDVRDNTLIPDVSGDPDGLDDYTYPYGVKTGCSMAVPVVSGIVALMLEQYRQSFFGSSAVDDAPLPSTFKGILCHTAGDLTVNPPGGADLTGPDYVYGYGLVDANAAVDAIRGERFREGVMLAEGDTDTYKFQVPVGEDELKVTLAWDDWEGVVGMADILQNDLDLLLIDPAGTTFHTPWELDPANPLNPAVRNTWASQLAAAAGADDRNVVEQVVVDLPDDGTWTAMVIATELPEPFQRYSLIAGDEDDDQIEGRVDIVQVLDRSGSMGGLASLSSAETKIVVLRSAADQFIQMMRPDVGNQLGLVQFNANVVEFDPVPGGTDLQPFTTGHAGDLSTAVAGIDHGGSTSIGGGLGDALTQFTDLGAAGHDRVVLLVSDGKENSPPMISAVQADLVNEQVAVYPLGLGYGSGLDEAELADLAEATGGTLRITADALIFRKFFIEVLAGAVDWTVIVDPVGDLASGDTVLVPVTVTADQRGASFTAYWEGEDDALELTLVPPEGPEIGPAAADVRFHEAARYAFYQLDFPRAGQWVGTWQMKIHRPSSKPGSVRYSASAFAEGGVTLDAGFDRSVHLTGDEVLLTARLTREGQPVTGADVRAYCDVPLVGAGNVLHDGKVKTAIYQPGVTHTTAEAASIGSSVGDPISAVDLKLQQLVQQAGRDLLLRGPTEVVLHDDGRHNDAGRLDGTYANRLRATQVPGSYTCRFVASQIPAAGGGTTTREWSSSFHNEVAIDPSVSILDARLIAQTGDGLRYRLIVAPKDRFGNFLGPGRTVQVAFTGLDPVTLQDNLDGTYMGEVTVAAAGQQPGGRLAVSVEGELFTTMTPPGLSRWWLSFHVGVAEPQGSFDTDFDADSSFAIDLEYAIRPRWRVVGLLGYHSFTSALPGLSDPYFVSLSANLKYRFRPDPVSGYLRVGPGLYWPHSGSAELGANFALGVEWDYPGPVTLDFGLDYHTLIDPDVDFMVLQLGVLLRL